MRPVISGTVTAPEGPVALARVLLEEAPAPVPDIAALTGEDGTFAMATVGPGRYVLMVYADGHRPGRADVTVHDRDVHVAVGLEPDDG
jgi:Carboxypeptidase regulatory-like domain